MANKTSIKSKGKLVYYWKCFHCGQASPKAKIEVNTLLADVFSNPID